MAQIPIPTYVEEYVDQLNGGKVPPQVGTGGEYSAADVKYEQRYDSDRGWGVVGIDAATTTVVSYENIEPAPAPVPPKPPVEFDPTPPLITPVVAPAIGYCILQVENVGLPDGYAAPTVIYGRANGTNGSTQSTRIDVPFRGQYTLPIVTFVGGGQLGRIIYDVIATGSVLTTSGEFTATAAASIAPIDSEFYPVTVQWVRTINAVPVVPIIEPPAPIEAVPLPPAPPLVIPVPSVPVPPVLQLSTDPPLPPPLPLQPPRYDLNVFRDPEEVYRATTVEEMFSYTPGPTARTAVYEVGRAPTIASVTFKIRNNTTTTPLKFQFIVPDFLRLSVPTTITINPAETVLIVVTFNELTARTLSVSGTYHFAQLLRWRVTPLNVTGPVYVRRALPPVAL